MSDKRMDLVIDEESANVLQKAIAEYCGASQSQSGQLFPNPSNSDLLTLKSIQLDLTLSNNIIDNSYQKSLIDSVYCVFEPFEYLRMDNEWVMFRDDIDNLYLGYLSGKEDTGIVRNFNSMVLIFLDNVYSDCKKRRVI